MPLLPAVRRLLAPALLGCAALAGAGEPCTPAFDDLREEVALRAHLVRYAETPEERAERAGLAKVGRFLRRPSRGLRRDVATAGSAAGELVALYPGEGGIEDLLEGLFDDLRGETLLERDDLVLTAEGLPGGEDRDAAEARAAEAGDALDLEATLEPLDFAGRAAALVAAAGSLERGYRESLQGRDRRPRRTCGDELWVREGADLLWRADRVVAVWQKSQGILTLQADRSRFPADDATFTLVATDVFGLGDGDLAFGSGVYREFTFTRHGFVESGTLTVTAVDADAGTMEGTFALTARGCLFRCAAWEITGGRFRLRNLRVF